MQRNIWGILGEITTIIKNATVLVTNLICLVLPFLALYCVITDHVGKAFVYAVTALFFIGFNYLLGSI